MKGDGSTSRIPAQHDQHAMVHGSFVCISWGIGGRGVVGAKKNEEDRTSRQTQAGIGNSVPAHRGGHMRISHVNVNVNNLLAMCFQKRLGTLVTFVNTSQNGQRSSGPWP